MKKKEIRGLLDGEGNWCEEKTDITNIVVSYFKELYSTSFPTRAMEVANLILRRITRKMNEDVTKEFQKEEVIQAVRQMNPTNVLGPNSMSAIFYQKYWDIIREDVIKTILNILNFNAPITELNKTNIALIPKINNSTKISEFRPISLYNVSYKIVPKVLANRLKPLLQLGYAGKAELEDVGKSHIANGAHVQSIVLP